MPATALARAPGAPISWPSNGVQGRQPAADGGAPPRLAGVRPDSSEPLWDLASPPLAGVGPPGAGIAADAGSHAELLADAVGAELHRIADLRGIDP